MGQVYARVPRDTGCAPEANGARLPLLSFDFLRFESVYVVMFAANALLLWLLVDGARLPSFLAQALCLVVTTVMSYLGHKFFSFQRAR